MYYCFQELRIPHGEIQFFRCLFPPKLIRQHQGGLNLTMGGFFCVLLAVFVVAAPARAMAQATGGADSEFGRTPAVDDSQIQDGWLSLFDGETFFGWTPVTQANWEIKNGEIHVSHGEPGLLRTSTQFDDFELRLEFKGDPHTNSGVFLRTSPRPTNPQDDCYELNIAHRNDHSFPTGSLVNRAATDADVEIEAWNQLRVVVDGPQVNVWVNEVKALSYTDPKPLGRGYIGLQFKSGPIAFRNIHLKPLNVREMKIVDGLPGWNTDQKLESEFTVSGKGELKIIGGRGQLETKEQFADFIFSLKCRTNAAGLNSGIFFRCIPGELTNGYESQIQNQFQHSDRTQPVDCGTGGIFRRVNARRVNANDQQWFAKTIITTGPHISVWVNGYQVTDWADERKPDLNPRKGLRLEKGTIMIQGHDPTTDILMKEIGVRELAPRGR